MGCQKKITSNVKCNSKYWKIEDSFSWYLDPYELGYGQVSKTDNECLDISLQ